MNDKKYSILVIEDETVLLNVITKKLESNDFNVSVSKSVEEALHSLKEKGTFDVIWLDHYLLGKETGLDFVAQIKADSNFKNIPVFVVSNTGTADKMNTYMKLGTVKYYVKANFKLEEIIQDIKNHLDNKENE